MKEKTYAFTDAHSLESALGRAPELAGNHRAFGSFGWRRRPDNDRDYTIVYTSNRDSCVRTRSNARVTDKALAPYCDNEHAWSESHGHWACGHIDGYVIRVYLEGPPEADGERPLSAAFVEYSAILDAIEQYPLLDEDDCSDAECEEADLVWRDCYKPADRIEYMRKHSNQFDCLFQRDEETCEHAIERWRDLLAQVRGAYFRGYASELCES